MCVFFSKQPQDVGCRVSGWEVSVDGVAGLEFSGWGE